MAVVTEIPKLNSILGVPKQIVCAVIINKCTNVRKGCYSVQLTLFTYNIGLQLQMN